MQPYRWPLCAGPATLLWDGAEKGRLGQAKCGGTLHGEGVFAPVWGSRKLPLLDLQVRIAHAQDFACGKGAHTQIISQCSFGDVQEVGAVHTI